MENGRVRAAVARWRLHFETGHANDDFLIDRTTGSGRCYLVARLADSCRWATWRSRLGAGVRRPARRRPAGGSRQVNSAADPGGQGQGTRGRLSADAVAAGPSPSWQRPTPRRARRWPAPNRSGEPTPPIATGTETPGHPVREISHLQCLSNSNSGHVEPQGWVECGRAYVDEACRAANRGLALRTARLCRYRYCPRQGQRPTDYRSAGAYWLVRLAVIARVFLYEHRH